MTTPVDPVNVLRTAGQAERSVLLNMNVILPIIISISWFVFILVPAGNLAVEDAKKGIPENERRGVSILPIFPVVPVILWVLTYWIDKHINLLSEIIISIHILLLIVAITCLVRSHKKLKQIETEPAH